MNRKNGGVRLSEKPLVIFSRTHGPQVLVRKLRMLEVRDATPEDEVEVRFLKHTLPTDPEPIRLRGSSKKKTNFPGGTVQVIRLTGTAALTVIAHCEGR